MKPESAPGKIAVKTETGSQDFTALKECLANLLTDSFPSGLSLAVVGPEGACFCAYGGSACRTGTHRPITTSTSYDLASLTKVVCSVTLALVFVERQMISLEDPVQRWLGGFPRSDTTLLHLITHTSGLSAHRPFFEHLRGRPAIEAAVLDEAARSAPTSEVLYSDLNFMLLGWVLEACAGSPLDELFAREVAFPLGMRSTGFRPPPGTESAATELDGDQRLVPGLVWGEVHDGNCWALGGVAGHAGLFGPLEDLTTFVRHLLTPDGRVLGPAALRAIAERRAGQPPEIRGLGWRLQPQGWGDWPEDTLWHTGFTGTSLLVSRSIGLGVVLLTNAIHPHRHLEQQAEMRAVIHRRVSEAFA
ncbi:MAG: serine hydrolase domain-containing protein [Acidimicrobiales bacterium]